MKKKIANLTLTTALVFASANLNAANLTLLRRIGQAASCAASMADTVTTLRPGLVETNPLLGAGKPQAGKMISLKLVVCAGQIAVSEIRKSKTKDTIGAISGVGQAGIFTGLAIHNARLK